MTRVMRLGAVLVLITAVSVVAAAAAPASAASPITYPYFDSLTPAPFATVSAGPVLIGAHAFSDAVLSDVTLMLNGSSIAVLNSASDQMLAIARQRVLTAGTYTATVSGTDVDGKVFKAQWDFVVSNNANDGEWFNADGTPKADQINATMRSLVEAFRWHLYGQSWDGADHPDLPSHVGLTGTGAPLNPWVNGTTFNQANTDATLRSLVEAFRWHFWGISWDGSAHCDVPTHAVCALPKPAQGIDPWFSASGDPIPANISATLRSLVEAFRWHFWGYSWDGSHHPEMPTHAIYGGGITPAGPPAEDGTVYQSNLTDVPALTTGLGSVGTPTATGFSLTIHPNIADGVTNSNTSFGDGSYSLTMRKLTGSGNAASCLLFRVVDSSSGGGFYQYCFLYRGNALVSTYVIYLAGSAGSSNVREDDIAQYTLGTPLSASDWNTLKVIAQGNQFWFYLNEHYFGMATHSGTTTGSVGFSLYNLDSQNDQTIEYTNMVVKNLQSTAASLVSVDGHAIGSDSSFSPFSSALRNLANATEP